MKLSEISISRPVLASMMSLGLILFGVIGLSRLPVRELPDIDPPIVNITTVYQGASAAVIETQVTEPIEETLTSVEGIRTLTSESREQVSSITVEFDLSRPIEVAAQDVRDRVSRVRGVLPDNIEEPIVAKQDADAQPILWIALFSDRFSTLELTSLAENVFKDRLQTINGVSSVIFGGQKRFAIRLWLDSQKMAARQVTVLDVQTALKEQNVELPSGLIESWSRALSIETRGEMKTPDEYNNLVIKRDGATFIRLSDIGRASVGVEDERSIARFNSRPAVGIGIVKQSKANTIDVAKKIKAELARIKETLPADVQTTIPYDESVFVEKSIHEVWETLGIAFFLVVLTIFIFLHNFRSTLVPSVSIPVSIIATFGLLYVMGYSINTVTMLAFVLAIGLVVDDSIIVLENIYRHVEEGMNPLEAAYKGMSEIGFAVIATTIALVAVFFPMAFQTSVTGRLFVEFAFALCFSVIISAFVALTLAPMASSKILKPADPNKKLGGLLGIFERSLKKNTERYERSLGWTLKHSWVAVPVFAAAIGLSVFFYTQLEQEFLPAEDKGRLLCIAIAPEGSTSEYTDRMVRKMEEIIAATPEVEGYFSAVALARGSPGKSSQGLAFLRLKEDRTKHIRDIVGGPTGLAGQFFGRVEGAFVIPIIPQAIGRGFTQPFQLVLQGQDLDVLNKYAEELSNKLRASGLLMNVRSNFEINKPELRVHIDRDRAAALGVTVEDISRTLQILFGGLDLSKVNIGGKQYDVIVQLERESRLSPGDLDKLYIPNNKGQLIQLSNVVTYDAGAGPSAINHYNRYRSATLEATPVGAPLGTVIARVKDILKEDMPDGVAYAWAGDARDLLESSSQIYLVMLLAALVIYMVLAAQFESLVHPLTIMLTLPLAAFGAFGGLWLMNWVDQLGMMAAAMPGQHWYSHLIPRIPSMGINLFSQIGMVMLFGLVTKNGILLVDFANQQMAKGKTAQEAMLAAGVIRLRPILMTACATIAGILPIAIGFGAGAESRRPLGVAAVGGMLTSTFLTLFVIPVVYVWFSKLQKSKVVHQAVKSSVPLVLICCLFLSGCSSLLPEYQRPDDTAPIQWKHEVSSKKSSVFPEDAKWWTLFGDNALNDLQEQTLVNNQDLRSAVAAVDKARALARIEGSALSAQVDFNPSIIRSRETRNAVRSSGFQASSSTSTKYRLPLDLSYEVDFWGKVRSAFESGQALAQASEEAFHAVRLTLTADVAQTYYLLRELDAEVETLVKTIELRQKAVDVVRDRVQGGVSSELDFSRASTELAQAQADIIDVRRRRAEVENRLALLCGVPASDFQVPAAELKAEIPSIPAGLPSELLKRRPDIAEAERNLAAASARIGVAQAEFFPSVRLTGSAGLESVDFDHLFDWESRVASFGPSVQLPIFNGGKNKARLKAARADFAMAMAKYQQQILKAFQETEDALNNVQLRHQQVAAQEQLVKVTSASSKLSITRYRQGLVSFLEVVDAERTRLQAELEAIQVKTEEIIATVHLIKALGGSW